MKKIYLTTGSKTVFLTHLLFGLLLMLSVTTDAQVRYPSSPGVISITAPNTVYYQNFDALDTMGSYWPVGWQGSELGSGANGSYLPSTGAITTSNIYSFGYSFYYPERALGSLNNSTTMAGIKFGAYFKNNTGNSIDTIQLDFVMEQWRNGNVATYDSSFFEYTKNRPVIDGSGWTRDNQGTLVSKVTSGTASALDGNNIGNRRFISVLLTGLTINAGDTFMIRWNDSAFGGPSDGLAIDSFRLVMDPYIAPPSPYSCMWTGNSSTDWSNISNWSVSSRVPTAIDNVTIPATTNQPVIGATSAFAGTLTIASGASLTLSSASSTLSVSSTFTNNGTLNNTNGAIRFTGSSAQSVPAGSYGTLEVTNAGGISLAGNVTVNSLLNLSGGSLALGNYDLTFSGTGASISNNTSTRYIITNGAGSVKFALMGSGGRGIVTVPIGSSATSYNPVVFNNTGSSDTYSFRVFNGISDIYTGANYTLGTLRTSNAVNRTWIINEALAGGSNATVNLQWNAADELSGFTRTSSYVALYNGSTWAGTATTAATGTGPYVQNRNTVSNMGAFGVGSSGQLPVTLMNFEAARIGNAVYLNWATASEENNEGFNIERSFDGNNFSKINFVKGNGNATGISKYVYADESILDVVKALPPVIYYRLKQVNNDGSSSYSKIISTASDPISNGGVVYPNPFTTDLKVLLTANAGSEVAVSITDITGKELAADHYTTAINNEIIPLTRLNEINGGIFFLRLTVNGVESVQKIVKY